MLQEVRLHIPAERRLHSWWRGCTPAQTAEALELAAGICAAMNTIATSSDTQATPLDREVKEDRRPPRESATAPTDVTDVVALLADTVPCEIAAERNHYILTTAEDGRRVFFMVHEDENLRSKDIECFCKEIFGSQDLDGAMYISANTRIPNASGSCQVKYIETKTSKVVPTILLGSSCRAAVQLAICSLVKMMEGTRAPMPRMEKEYEALKRTLPNLCQQLDAREAPLEARIVMLQSLLNEAYLERDEDRDIAYAQQKLRATVPWLTSSRQDQKPDLDAAIEVYDLLAKDGSSPRTSNMTAMQRQTIKNAGGIRAVAAAVARRMGTPNQNTNLPASDDQDDEAR